MALHDGYHVIPFIIIAFVFIILICIVCCLCTSYCRSKRKTEYTSKPLPNRRKVGKSSGKGSDFDSYYVCSTFSPTCDNNDTLLTSVTVGDSNCGESGDWSGSGCGGSAGDCGGGGGDCGGGDCGGGDCGGCD